MNLANKITVIRFLLVPVFIYLAGYTEYSLATLIVFSLAAFTDFIDGYIARKYHMVTDLGKFMDPLADKILTLSAFILFSSQALISPIVTIVVVMREITISVFRAVAASKNIVIAASIYGKLKTVSQMMTIIIMYLYIIIGRSHDIFISILIVIMTALTLLSGLDYIYKNRQVLKEK